LRFDVSLEKAQLGQLTHLIYGRDRGWRGTVDAQASLSGSPKELHGAGKISVTDFRRYDIVSSDSFSALVRCDGILAVNERRDEDNALAPGQRVLRGSCTLPSGKGIINATGYYRPAAHAGSVNLMAASFPLSTVVFLAKHMKRGIADDLAAEGVLNGRIALHKGSVPPEPGAMQQDGRENWTLTAAPTLHSKLLPAMNLGVLVFNFDEPSAAPSSLPRRKVGAPSDAPARLTLLPAQLALGGAAPAVLSASADRAGYKINLEGEADVELLQNFLQTLGLPPAPEASKAAVARSGLALAQTGNDASTRARVNLEVNGSWSGFSAPAMAGTVHAEPAPALSRRTVQ